MNSGKWSYGSYGQNKMTGKGYWGDKKYEQSSGLLQYFLVMAAHPAQDLPKAQTRNPEPKP